MLLLNFYHLQICVTVEILCHNPSAKGFKCTSLCTRARAGLTQTWHLVCVQYEQKCARL